MTRLLIIGATSDIARSCARKFGKAGFDLTLAARRPENLKEDVKDLRLRFGIAVDAVVLDILAMSDLESWWSGMDPIPDGILCAVGTMKDMIPAKTDPIHLKRLIDTNLTGPAMLLTVAAETFRKRGYGFIIGISSVAGNRGRGSNYPYGCPKAGFTAFLSGLRSRLNDSGVHVLTVLPGFVRTKMTEDLDLPAPLTATSQQVTDDIFRAWQKKKSVVYSRWHWRFIMTVISHLPEFVFRKTKF